MVFSTVYIAQFDNFSHINITINFINMFRGPTVRQPYHKYHMANVVHICLLGELVK